MPTQIHSAHMLMHVRVHSFAHAMCSPCGEQGKSINPHTIPNSWAPTSSTQSANSGRPGWSASDPIAGAVASRIHTRRTTRSAHPLPEGRNGASLILLDTGVSDDLAPGATSSANTKDCLGGHTLSGASWRARTRQAYGPALIAPTHGDAALMILRRYCA
jgi:hypothetical protein